MNEVDDKVLPLAKSKVLNAFHMSYIKHTQK
ncbi:hypothetical protein Bhyg_10108 [Pseudolycoriella hygida]|uniref:Uncharacterized protein n=1 Tax=Pseudolycoriella hygida TaxID=35572 RepID=A0A9Q0RYX3_9DIPT|nr:hypothetical protein Bhyg_10108 [Pseudolycoriella hygida]